MPRSFLAVSIAFEATQVFCYFFETATDWNMIWNAAMRYWLGRR